MVCFFYVQKTTKKHFFTVNFETFESLNICFVTNFFESPLNINQALDAVNQALDVVRDVTGCIFVIIETKVINGSKKIHFTGKSCICCLKGKFYER